MKHSNFLLLLPTTFVFLLWMNTPSPVNCSITSVEEPDWTISKADLVNSLYSYEPYDSSRSGSSNSGREFRALFPSLFSSGSSQHQQQQQQQRRIQHGPSRPQIKGSYGPPNQFQPITNNNNAPVPNNVVQYGPPQPNNNLNYKQQPQNRPGSKPDEYTGQPPPPINNPSQPMIKLLPGSVPPQLTKFSLEDNKVGDNNGQQSFSYGNGGLNNNNIPSITSTSAPLVGPMYLPSNPTSQSSVQSGYQNQLPSDAKYSQMSSVDSQTIIWPKQSSETDLATGANGDDTQVRFLVHKPGDENIIRNALLEDGKERNQEVKFIEGPTLRIQRHQKVYLPPKKKTVVYILLKEPQIQTDVEVVGPTEYPVPEVFITYQKSDGVVKTNHYSPEVVKNDKYLSQLKDSAQSAMGVGQQQQKSASSSSETSTSSNTSNSSANTIDERLSSSNSGGGYGGVLSATGEQNSPIGPQSLSQSQRYYYGVNSFNVDDQQQGASSQHSQQNKGPAVHLRPVRGSSSSGNSFVPSGPVFLKEKSNESKRTSSEQTASSSSRSSTNHNDHTPISCTLTSQTQSTPEKGGHSSSSSSSPATVDTVAHSTASS